MIVSMEDDNFKKWLMLKKIIITAVIFTALISGAAIYFLHESNRPPLLEIYIFALKTGQAIFMRTPNDKRILVDGGSNSEVIRDISSVLPFYSRRIDMLIATKADGKRVSGLIDVLNRYSVGEVVIPGTGLVDLGLASSTDQIYQSFIDATEEAKVPIKKVLAGDSIFLDDYSLIGPVKFGVLFPIASSTTGGIFQYSNASAPELVTKISYGSTSVMLAGSVTPKIQKFISSASSTAASSTDLKSNILILSQNATTSNIAAAFMSAVSPDDIIYSKAKAANLLEDHRFNIREVGTLKIVSDGKSIRSISHP